MPDSNIALFKVFMAEDTPIRVKNVLGSGFVGQGQEVEQFELLLRRRFGGLGVNTLNSATSGLHLAVHMAKDIHGRDEVLTTPLTCSATNFAILGAGARIRWVDVDPTTGNMSMRDLESKIGPRTLAIMVVHWGGYPCELEWLKAIQTRCKQRHLFTPPVIEDCAHAWGATYQDKLIGTHGNICVFSFQAIKHLTTGDGGCMVSPDETHYQRAKLLRWYGFDRTSSADFRCSQNIGEWGFKFHMNDINATIGIANFRHASRLVAAHQANGRYYNEALKNMPGMRLMASELDRESAFWVYTVRVKDRTNFVRKMAERGIATSQVHSRNDRYDCLKEFRCELPGLDVLAEEMICLPCGWWVTEQDREYIVDCIREGW